MSYPHRYVNKETFVKFHIKTTNEPVSTILFSKGVLLQKVI